jgi:hypothetical protein
VANVACCRALRSIRLLMAPLVCVCVQAICRTMASLAISSKRSRVRLSHSPRFPARCSDCCVACALNCAAQASGRSLRGPARAARTAFCTRSRRTRAAQPTPCASDTETSGSAGGAHSREPSVRLLFACSLGAGLACARLAWRLCHALCKSRPFRTLLIFPFHGAVNANTTASDHFAVLTSFNGA